MNELRRLLWIDSIGGLLVGALVLSLTRWLSGWYALPPSLLTAMGIANLLYGSFSFTLARRGAPSRALVRVLVGANALWMAVCLVIVVIVLSRASILGVAAVLLEGLYVGGLAALEWRANERRASG